MYEKFRNDVIAKMSQTIGNCDINKILGVLDTVATRYDVKERELDLVPYTFQIPELVNTYLMCRSIEGLSANTLEHYRTILETFFSTVRKTPENVNVDDVRSWMFLYQRHRGITNRTLDGYRTVINSFFSWALDEEYIVKNPCGQIKPIKYTRKPRVALGQLELEYIREACRNEKDRAIVEMLYSTGCRVSELAKLKKSDIDWNKKEILVLGKGAKYRTCYINSKAYVALERYLATRKDDSEYVFVTDRAPHHNITKEGLERIVRIINKRAGEKVQTHVTPHVFRHTTATVALQNGMPVQDVQIMLGHTNINTTMIYAEVNLADVKSMHGRCVI